MPSFDVAVVGGGVVGSWTALHLVRQGKNVLLLEQFESPHTRGSSHGQSRLIRSAYSERYFAQLMPTAIGLWKELELQAATKIFQQCGALCVSDSPAADEEFCHSLIHMAEFCPDGLLDDEDDPRLEGFFSKQLRFGEQRKSFLDASGGVLLAHKAVLALQDLFRKAGGTFWDGCRVGKLVPRGASVVLETATRGEVVAEAVVVCAGTWTRQLLVPDFFPSLPLQPEVVRVYYWKEKEAGAYSAASGFPAFIDLGEACVYAIPSLEYPGLVKVSLHGGVPCDPDARDRTPPDQEKVAQLTEYVREHFPLLHPEPAIVETCMYTTTPDEAFVVDVVPGHSNIVVGAGFSGTGFKTSPSIGKLLSELATGQTPSLDISAFRITRFQEE